MKLAAIPVCILLAVSSPAQRGGWLDSLFSRYPFDKWAAQDAKPQLHWTTSIDRAFLSPHQRLAARIRVSVDGAELKARRNHPMIVFVRIEDAAGHRYQTVNRTQVSRLGDTSQVERLNYFFSAFFLPGDYTVSLAVCDGKTLEHSFVRRRFHVAPLRADPLPQAWQDLSPVEFIPEEGIPYSWYLPQSRSAVRLPLGNEHPVRVEILANTTPTDMGSIAQFRSNMAAVVPSLKVLMGLDPANGSVGVTVLDLNRRAVTWEEPSLRPSGVLRGDWDGLRPALTGFSAAQVDAKTLAGERKMTAYFTSEVNRLLDGRGASPGVRRVLIVLSAPVYLTRQETTPRPDPPPEPSRRVFYIRCSQVFPAMKDGESGSFRDDLERILRRRGARIFRVSSPVEFRKALGAILAEIAAP